MSTRTPLHLSPNSHAQDAPASQGGAVRRIGVLALQGGFDAHVRALESCGAQVHLVRDAQSLDEADALVIPGGESTTMSRLLERYGLWQPLQEKADAGMPLFGTCAGAILLSQSVTGATQNFEQRTLGALDIDVARNAYGRQADSFEADVAVPVLEEAGFGSNPLRGVFIRAPRLERVGGSVQVLASHAGEPVAVASGSRMACAFHPEISGDNRLHALWLQRIAQHASTCGGLPEEVEVAR
jgi:5'-phosphate synthase pdxT subunit